ncbi:MAG TPA: IS1380 family transposase [Solirubrobacteraceae bacterium]|nr:IS1380 family transposase [Solirubrobacteraceae bacterium]
MVHDGADVPQGPASLDQVRVSFDEERLISDAGLMLCATLADRLGLEELVNESVWLDPSRPGACLPGRKVMSLVHGMLAGADCIDDMNLLRAGSTGLILGHRVMAPSTLGTFLRAFTFGHVRQLDHVLDQALARAWQAGAGPGDGMPLVIDIDSFVGEVHGYQKQGASYGYTRKLGYHPLLAIRADTGEVIHIRNRKGKANTQRGIARFIDELIARVRRAGHTGQIIIRMDSGFENHKLFKDLAKRGIGFSIGVKQSPTIKGLIEQIPEDGWQTVADYPDGGQAQVAETELKGFRLIVRRTRLTGKQADLFPNWRHHCFATNRTLPILVADTDHRDHATVELAIRDLIDQALAHFPSGQMNANSAWTVIAALAHNLGRWSTQIGLPDRPVQTARARRRQLLAIPARLTRTSRQWTLRMPARWPWQTDFHTVLDRLRALPALT